MTGSYTFKEYEKLSNQFETVSAASMIPTYQDRRNWGGERCKITLFKFKGADYDHHITIRLPSDFLISYGTADYFIVVEGMTEVLQEFIL